MGAVAERLSMLVGQKRAGEAAVPVARWWAAFPPGKAVVSSWLPAAPLRNPAEVQAVVREVAAAPRSENPATAREVVARTTRYTPPAAPLAAVQALRMLSSWASKGKTAKG